MSARNEYHNSAYKHYLEKVEYIAENDRNLSHMDEEYQDSAIILRNSQAESM